MPVPVRLFPILAGLLCATLPARAQDAPFEEATHDIGNVGLTVTNAGFLGRANVRNNPAGAPSFEYPLNSGVEHLFEAGLWIGAYRRDGLLTVRTGAITSSAGYRAGAEGYEFAQLTPFTKRSTLPSSPFFFPGSRSQHDFQAAYTDTARFIPGTLTPYPAYAERLGLVVDQRSYAYNFPFAESFVIVEFNIVNKSKQAWDSVYVGMYHDLVVRNVNTNTDAGTAYFNKGGYGFIDTLQTSYAFNAGGHRGDDQHLRRGDLPRGRVARPAHRADALRASEHRRRVPRRRAQAGRRQPALVAVLRRRRPGPQPPRQRRRHLPADVAFPTPTPPSTRRRRPTCRRATRGTSASAPTA